MLNPQQFKLATGSINLDVLNALNSAMNKYRINTPLRIRHFLSQILHESQNLTAVKENLNYSSNALMAVWKRSFPTKEIADMYARKPESIGNKAYANRMGNGSEASGDGFKFRGRGYIQITGKDNYKALSKSFGIDLILKPELLETPMYASLSAAWFWYNNSLNAIADSSLNELDTIIAITKKINGGTNGLTERINIYKKLKGIIK